MNDSTRHWAAALADAWGIDAILEPLPGEFDLNSPINSTNLGAACGNSLPGWPCDKTLDELRAAWIRQTDPAKRRDALEAFHKRAYEALPYIPVGQFSPVYAVRNAIRHADRL